MQPVCILVSVSFLKIFFIFLNIDYLEFIKIPVKSFLLHYTFLGPLPLWNESIIVGEKLTLRVQSHS